MSATELQLGKVQRELRKHDLSLTAQRQTVLQGLADRGPISIAGLRRALGAKSPHRVTLYRTVEQLEEIGLVKRVRFRHEDEDRYELGDAVHPHHHHLVCEGCGIVAAVSAEPRRPKLPRGFKLLGHQLEFYGRCARCAKGAA